MSAGERDREAARAWFKSRVLERYNAVGGVVGYRVDYNAEAESELAAVIATARAEARREAFEEAQAAMRSVARRDIDGCDGDSGRCYAQMEFSDDGEWLAVPDVFAALRAKAGEEAPHE